MGDFSEHDFEGSVSRAWQVFERWLADVLTGMDDDDVLVVSVESAGDEEVGAATTPYVQFAAWSPGLVHGEVSSSHYLADRFRLDDGQTERLVELGYRLPDVELATADAANFVADVERAHGDRLAFMAVSALRDVFGVLHPAFLALGSEKPNGSSGMDEITPTLDLPPYAAAIERGELDDEGMHDAGPIDMPDGPDELRALIDAALTPLLGRHPMMDEDGDFVVPHGSAIVYVRAVESAPVISIFSQLVRGVTDELAAAREVADLNRSIEMVKFFLVEDRIVAGCSLPALPFVGEHVRQMLGLIAEVANDLDDPLAALVGGNQAIDVSDDD